MTGSPRAGLPSGTDPGTRRHTALSPHNAAALATVASKAYPRGHRKKARRLNPAAHIPAPDATNPTQPGTPAG